MLSDLSIGGVSSGPRPNLTRPPSNMAAALYSGFLHAASRLTRPPQQCPIMRIQSEKISDRELLRAQIALRSRIVRSSRQESRFFFIGYSGAHQLDINGITAIEPAVESFSPISKVKSSSSIPVCATGKCWHTISAGCGTSPLGSKTKICIGLPFTMTSSFAVCYIFRFGGD